MESNLVAATAAEVGARAAGRAPVARRLFVPLAIAMASRLFSIACIVAMSIVGRGTANPFTLWDGTWYLGIVNGGYSGYRVAFFPGWPVSIKIATLGFLDPAAVAVVVANMLAVAAIVAVWVVLDARLGRDAADRGTLLLAFAPAAFVLSMAYSEALFLLVVALAFLASDRLGRIPASALAMLIRSTSVALLVAGFVAAIRAKGVARRNLVWATAAGCVALAGWAGAVGLITGDPLGFFHFGSSSWTHEDSLATAWDVIQHPAHEATLLLRMATLAVVIAGAVVVLRRDLELGVFSCVALCLAVVPGSMVGSYARYALAAFPAYAGLGRLFGRKGTLLLAIAFAAIQVVLIHDTLFRHIAP